MLTVRWRNMAAVLKDARPIGVAFGGVIVAIVLAFAAGWFLSRPLSAVVRYTGMILQIGGLSTVAIGLSNMRRLFGRPSLTDRISSWFGRLAAVFSRPKSHTIEVSAGALGLAGVRAEAEVVTGVRPGASLEERVSAVEENVNRLRQKLNTRVQELRGELATANETIQREIQERQAADKETVGTIEEVAIGGLHLEMVGLFWLFLGIMGTSIPDEIVALLSLIVWGRGHL